MVKTVQVIVILTFLGCSDYLITDDGNQVINNSEFLHLYMDLPQDSNGYYWFNYPNGAESSYTSVEGFSNPMNRIFWGSDDTFTFIHWGEEITQPIINNSSYTSSDSTLKQLIYLYPPFIGDTLSIYGCLFTDDSEICKGLDFIVY